MVRAALKERICHRMLGNLDPNFVHLLSPADFYVIFFHGYNQNVKQFGQDPDISSGLIWVQMYCNCYKQTALQLSSAGKDLEKCQHL